MLWPRRGMRAFSLRLSLTGLKSLCPAHMAPAIGARPPGTRPPAWCTCARGTDPTRASYRRGGLRLSREVRPAQRFTRGCATSVTGRIEPIYLLPRMLRLTLSGKLFEMAKDKCRPSPRARSQRKTWTRLSPTWRIRRRRRRSKPAGATPAAAQAATSCGSNAILGTVRKSLDPQWNARDRSTLDRTGGLRSERGHDQMAHAAGNHPSTCRTGDQEHRQRTSADGTDRDRRRIAFRRHREATVISMPTTRTLEKSFGKPRSRANPDGIPAVYEVDGRQYVAFYATGGGGDGIVTRATKPEAQGYYVFALPNSDSRSKK